MEKDYRVRFINRSGRRRKVQVGLLTATDDKFYLKELVNPKLKQSLGVKSANDVITDDILKYEDITSIEPLINFFDWISSIAIGLLSYFAYFSNNNPILDYILPLMGIYAIGTIIYTIKKTIFSIYLIFYNDTRYSVTFLTVNEKKEFVNYVKTKMFNDQQDS
jgi:hypothetical protein